MARFLYSGTDCSVDGCDRYATRRALCSMHYKRWKRWGDPTAVDLNRRQPILMNTGYLRVWCPGHPVANADGYALLHRKVWYDAFGVPPEDCHVHHVNGDRTDNRIENLEVLAASEHRRQHVAALGTVKNQYGTWTLRSRR